MTLQGKKILAIDDTASIRAFLRVSLEDEGAQFYEAGTAEEGIKRCQDVSPDLVVLDLGLPDRDGLDILPEIKEMQEGLSPAVIVLTVRRGRQTINEAMQKGADAYLSKPFMVNDLIEKIEERLLLIED